MNCPVCGTRLREIEKYGVEIDICPDCKGVWLDRGELEKVIAMESAGGPQAPPREERRERQPREAQAYDDDDRDRDAYRDDRQRHPYKKKRESWFSEIFDGFGGD